MKTLNLGKIVTITLGLLFVSCQVTPSGRIEEATSSGAVAENQAQQREQAVPSPIAVESDLPAELVESSAPELVASSPSPLETPKVTESFSTLPGVNVSYQFGPDKREFILRELAKIPLLDLPQVKPPEGTLPLVKVFYLLPLKGILALLKKNPLFLVAFDVMNPEVTYKDSALADAMGFMQYEDINAQRVILKHMKEVFNNKILTKAHRFPQDPVIPYKFELNYVIRIGALFDYDSKNSNYAKIGLLFSTIMHEMRHFHGREFDHAADASGYTVDAVSNGPFSIEVPILERLMLGCSQHKQNASGDGSISSKFRCDDRDFGELLANHSFVYYSRPISENVPTGAGWKSEGATIAPL